MAWFTDALEFLATKVSLVYTIVKRHCSVWAVFFSMIGAAYVSFAAAHGELFGRIVAMIGRFESGGFESALGGDAGIGNLNTALSSGVIFAPLLRVLNDMLALDVLISCFGFYVGFILAWMTVRILLKLADLLGQYIPFT